ncbi:hypothetical protein HOF40_04205 [Candidatus Parcubacteria bacterium]|jgi:CxxC-x17-CxxC domain-containing protein|nr:hypothetical protein [Candidatus Parcubacteria bacterium]MBT3949265.1 hypothetical protein [Candidatus Parcubacteria bacterium]
MNDFNDRQMFDVDCECGKCGAKITQLPFQPSGDRPVYCSDCNKAHREQRNSGGGERKMFDVNVPCSGCGTQITQLPFEPRDTSNLLCKECYLKNKDA